MSVKENTWSFFKSKGLSDEAVAGIMGNIAVESNYNTTALNSSSGAFGLFQWLGSRQDSLLDYAEEYNASPSDLDIQLDFAWEELNTTEKRTLDALQSNKYNTASEYAIVFEDKFERSGGALLDRRKEEAEKAYSEFNGTVFKYVDTNTTKNNIGLKWWGDVVRILIIIGLLLVAVVFIYVGIMQIDGVPNIKDKIKEVQHGNE